MILDSKHSHNPDQTIQPKLSANLDTADVVIIGAGLAGIVAAITLAKQGLQVQLIDQASFPRWKVCGCCLNPFALSSLAEANLAHIPAELGAIPLDSVRLASRGVSASLALPGWISLSRYQLDSALIHHGIQAGVNFRPGQKARLGLILDDRRLIHLDEGATVAARLVLAADGLGGRLLADDQPSQIAPRSHIGIGLVVERASDFYQPGTIYMAHGSHGYLGLVRLEDQRLNLAAAVNPHYLKRCGHPGIFAEQLLKTVGWPTPEGLARLKWRGTPALTRSRSLLGTERVLAIGDAAGYVEPFTGEGMAWALASGLAVADVAQDAVRDWHSGVIQQWTTIHSAIIRQRQWVCRGLAWMLRRPSLTQGIVCLLQHFPALAHPWVGQIGAATKHRGSASQKPSIQHQSSCKP